MHSSFSEIMSIMSVLSVTRTRDQKLVTSWLLTLPGQSVSLHVFFTIGLVLSMAWYGHACMHTFGTLPLFHKNMRIEIVQVNWIGNDLDTNSPLFTRTYELFRSIESERIWIHTHPCRIFQWVCTGEGICFSQSVSQSVSQSIGRCLESGW